MLMIWNRTELRANPRIGMEKQSKNKTNTLIENGTRLQSL